MWSKSVLPERRSRIVQEFTGYFCQGQFVPFEAVVIPEYRKARVIVFDDPIPDEISRKMAELDSLEKMIRAAADEELPPFDRPDLYREVSL